MSHNDGKLVLTTSWDDGHPLDLRIAGLLAKHGLRGTFYVPLENSRPTLSVAQIHDLAASFEIGAHTVHHRILTELSDDEARAEVFESKARIEEITSKPCRAFCFPSGRFTRAHIHMLVGAGFSSARTVELLSIEFPSERDGIAMIPTTVQAHPHSSWSYMRNTLKRSKYTALSRFLLFDNYAQGWESVATALLCRAAKNGGAFHLWGHSWEIEENHQWQALERVLEAMAEAGQSTPCFTNSELCSNGH